jgi:hypothetical protein
MTFQPRGNDTHTGEPHQIGKNKSNRVSRTIQTGPDRKDDEPIGIDESCLRRKERQETIPNQHRPADPFPIEQSKAAAVEVQTPDHGAPNRQHERDKQDQGKTGGRRYEQTKEQAGCDAQL